MSREIAAVGFVFPFPPVAVCIRGSRAERCGATALCCRPSAGTARPPKKWEKWRKKGENKGKGKGGKKGKWGKRGGRGGGEEKREKQGKKLVFTLVMCSEGVGRAWELAEHGARLGSVEFTNPDRNILLKICTGE